MKTLVLILGLVFSLNGFAEVPVGFEQFDPRSQDLKVINNGLDLAIEYINKGAPTLNQRAVEVGKAVIKKLSSVIFLNATYGEAITHCSGREAFIDHSYLNNIFICPLVVQGIHSSGKRLATQLMSQLLIHEGVHLLGEKNECIATEFELKILINSGVENISRVNRDKYDNICDLRWADVYLPHKKSDALAYQ